MITSGRQIKAARALAGLDQASLARLAGLHRNAVVYWERRDSIEEPPYEPIAVRMMRSALKSAGVITTSDPAPGVQLCTAHNFPSPAPEIAA